MPRSFGACELANLLAEMAVSARSPSHLGPTRATNVWVTDLGLVNQQPHMLILKSSIKLWIFGGSISHNIPTVLWK